MSTNEENNNLQNQETVEEIEENTQQDELEKVKNEKEELQKKYDDIYDRFVRLAADFDNYKKRLSKEKSDIQNYGNEEIVKSLLNVLDNLERAITHAQTSEQNRGIVDGIQLVYDQFVNCLERFNVNAVESGEGVEFNPKYHEAIERVESEKHDSGIVISEMVKGYTLKDRLLRPSMVTVSKGKPRSDENTDNEQKTGDETDNSDAIDIEDETSGDDIIDLTEETNK